MCVWRETRASGQTAARRAANLTLNNNNNPNNPNNPNNNDNDDPPPPPPQKVEAQVQEGKALCSEGKRQILADIMVWAEITQPHYDASTAR